MTDTDRLLVLLQAAGNTGVHTADLRRQGVSGNPSQRRADLQERGHTITSTPEPYRSDPRRRGARYRLVPTPCSTAPDGLSVERAPVPLPPTLTGPASSSTRTRHAIDDDYDWDEAA